MFFAIIITTYRRSDGTTIPKLRKTLDSVFAQKYVRFKVFLIGDNFENPEDFFNLCLEYDQKYMYCENLTVQTERDNYKGVPNAIWSYGGTYAYNYAIQRALDLGYNYVCRMDHDDQWTDQHLSNLKECIEKTNSPWVCTVSYYLSNNNLCPPKIDISSGSPLFEKFDPRPGHVIHSSTCINFNRIPLRYVDLYKETGKVGLPGDAFMWEMTSNWLKENNETAYIVKRPTCFHLTEGYEKKNK